MLVVFSIEQVTTFQFFFSGLDNGKKHRQICVAPACSAMRLHHSCSLPPSIRQSLCRLHRSIQWLSDTIIVWAVVEDIIVTGSWNRRRRLAAWPDISLLRANYEFSSVFRITTYWPRTTMTASRRVGHINGLMFAPALLMQFLKRYIGLYTPKSLTNWRRRCTGDNEISYKITLQTVH